MRIPEYKVNKILKLYEEGFKTCTKCKRVKPIDEFYTITKGTRLLPLSPNCKHCAKVVSRKRYKALKWIRDVKKSKKE
jgi:hypothetical protein